MIDALHDLIDAREEITQRAKDRAKEIIKSRFFEAMEKTQDAEKAMELLALWVEEELTDLTTEAVNTSFDLTRKFLG